VTSKLLTAKGYAEGTVLQFTCLNNYELIGSNHPIRCDKKGQWSGNIPICVQPTTKKMLLIAQTTSNYSQGCFISQQNVDKKILSMINENYIEHGKKMNYSCFNNNLVQFTAYCLNGSLIIEQNCNEEGK
jgi:hypothetical protein